jgi:hypothetical protein
VALCRRGGGATADDGAAAVHGWRGGGATAEDGGALADDGGALVEVGRSLLDDGRVVGWAEAIGDDGGAPRENLAAWRRRFVFAPNLENFQDRVSCIYRWTHRWRVT